MNQQVMFHNESPECRVSTTEGTCPADAFGWGGHILVDLTSFECTSLGIHRGKNAEYIGLGCFRGL